MTKICQMPIAHEPIEKQIGWYKDGMAFFHELSEKARLHLLVNEPDRCPSGDRLDYLAA